MEPSSGHNSVKGPGIAIPGKQLHIWKDNGAKDFYHWK
jgi:hypothetical protein